MGWDDTRLRGIGTPPQPLNTCPKTGSLDARGIATLDLWGLAKKWVVGTMRDADSSLYFNIFGLTE